jgi:hypothetical protein
VDFPEPFGPIRPIRSASETVNEIFWNSGEAPYRFESPCALIIGGKLFGLLQQSVYPRRVRGAKRGGCKPDVIQELGTQFGAGTNAESGLEPIAAVGEPPARVANGDRRGERPPERKRHIGNQSKYREADPKYLPLHTSILDASALVMSRRRTKMFQMQMAACSAVATISKRSRHDS